jgi:hypothetical protein
MLYCLPMLYCLRLYCLAAEAVMDGGWRNNSSFAVCTGKVLFMCRLGDVDPVRTWQGHTQDIYSIKVGDFLHVFNWLF